MSGSFRLFQGTGPEDPDIQIPNRYRERQTLRGDPSVRLQRREGFEGEDAAPLADGDHPLVRVIAVPVPYRLPGTVGALGADRVRRVLGDRLQRVLASQSSLHYHRWTASNIWPLHDDPTEPCIQSFSLPVTRVEIQLVDIKPEGYFCYSVDK